MSSTPPAHSLPPRPPPPASGSFKPAFKPRTVASAAPSWSSANQAPSAPAQYSAQPYPQYQAGYSQQQPAAYPQAAAPVIRNPFVPTNGSSQSSHSGNTNYDPEYEAQVAQWHSAYAAKDDDNKKTTTSANAVSLGSRASDATKTVADAEDDKTVVRSGGGETWQDASLLEWDPAHFRLFVGNLAGEVTDDSMMKAFSKYPSVQKARVIRDKRTTKSRGYGFVSFSDGDDYFKAAKEMQGKYIGSHPVILRKANTEIKPVASNEKKKTNIHHHSKSGKQNNRPQSANKAGGHASTGAGITKKPPKTRDGLKILG